MFIKVRVWPLVWAPDPLIDIFSKINQLKGLEPKNKGHTNSYECCDLTKKYITSMYYLLNYSSNSTVIAQKKSLKLALNYPKNPG